MHFIMLQKGKQIYTSCIKAEYPEYYVKKNI